MSKAWYQEVTCPKGHERTIRRNAKTKSDGKYWCSECRKMVSNIRGVK